MSGPLVTIQTERRPVTVLFCDLVDSTSLAVRLAADEFEAVQQQLDRQGRQAAAMHGGDYRGLEGDAVIISFGASGAQENDAERAVRCGLDLVRRIAAMHEAIPFAGPLAARIGIDTDVAYIGPAPGNDNQSQVYGKVNFVAARLKEVTEPGTVLVSEPTWSRVRRSFSGHRLGAKQLKGIVQPLNIWRIDGEAANREPLDAPGVEAPIIGRSHEQHLLRQAWQAAREGEAQFILLVGEAGIGKSRLARALRDKFAPSEAQSFVLRATYDSRNQPFHPIVVFLERLFGIEGTDATEARLEKLSAGLGKLGIAEAAPYLGPLLSVDPKQGDQVLNLSPARRRARTLSSLVELFSALWRNSASLLIFEDLHWADASTGDFIEELVANCIGVPLLAVFTARPELDKRWDGTTGFRLIALDRLPAGDAELVAQGAAGAKPLLPHEVREILLRSDGVPLFIEELTRYVLESGVLKERESLPVQVHAGLMPRIDRLGAARPTAQIAAAIGREFSFSLLRAVSEREEAELVRDLRQMQEAGLAWPSADGDADSYMFKHALVRDAAYETLPLKDRPKYHREIAALLQGPFSRLAVDRDDLIASHLEAAKQYDAAMIYWQKAGARALKRTATKEAKRFFQSAVECLRRLPDSDERKASELMLLGALAPMLMTIHGWASNEVQQACEQGRALAEQLGCRDERLYLFVWGQWSVHFLRGELEPALADAQIVQFMAEASGIPLLRITGRHATSFTYLFRGDLVRALEEADAGLTFFELEQERELVKWFLLSSSVCLSTSRALALWMMGRIPEANREEARMLKMARKLGHLSYAGGLGFALMIGGIRYFHSGRMHRLRPIAEKLRRIGREEDFAMWHAVAEVYCGVLDELSRQPGGRARMLNGAEQFSERCSNRITLVLMYVMIAETLHATGENGEALKWLDDAEQEMSSRGEGLNAPEIWRVRGRILASQGDDAGAQQAYTQAIARAAEQKAKSLELRAALDLKDLFVSRGREPDLSLLHAISSPAMASQPVSQTDQVRSAIFNPTNL